MSGGDEYAALILVCITVGDLSPLGVLTARDIIWLSAAARLREEHEKQLRVEEWKAKDMQFSIHARGMLDLQFLALDIDNLLRIYMGGKKASLLRFDKLPSQRLQGNDTKKRQLTLKERQERVRAFFEGRSCLEAQS